MKTIPFIITILVVLLWNIIYEFIYDPGEYDTNKMITSGILAVIVHETSSYIYKKIKGKDKSNPNSREKNESNNI